MPWFLKCYKKYNHQYIAWREQPDSSDPHSQVGLSFNGNKKTFHSWPASYDWKHWTEHLQFPLSEVQEKTLFYFCNRAPDDSQHLNGRMTNPAVRIFILRWKRGSAPSPISERSMKTMHWSITRKFSLLKNYNWTIAWSCAGQSAAPTLRSVARFHEHKIKTSYFNICIYELLCVFLQVCIWFCRKNQIHYYWWIE